MSKEIKRWADEAMYEAEKSDAYTGPKVYLLNMNADPLADIAACAKMYKGEVARSLSDVTHEERKHYLEEMRKTKLKMPLEAVTFHFLLEDVTRSFTHQLVRQRTAAYAQESLRFAVKKDLPSAVTLPPSIAGLSPDHPQRAVWEQTVKEIDRAYDSLVNSGMPAEDARGLLPHNVVTRVHYITNLRALLDHAGNRLCTQAQFEWRLVFSQIAQAIRQYRPYAHLERVAEKANDVAGADFVAWVGSGDRWQYEAIADLLKPVCYQIGKCAFEAEFDRKCSIRSRVQANAEIGRPSSEWDEEYDAVEDNPVVAGAGPQSVMRDGIRGDGQPVFIGAIQPAEWLTDPGAAR